MSRNSGENWATQGVAAKAVRGVTISERAPLKQRTIAEPKGTHYLQHHE